MARPSESAGHHPSGAAPAKIFEEIRRHFDQLDADLRRYDQAYYGAATSEISDQLYDEKRREWRALRERYPQLARSDRPERVGDDRNPKFKKVDHLQPMLSLGNTYSRDELRAFVDRLQRGYGDEIDFALEPKIDGAGATLIYRRGHFAYGLSRGNGSEGDDISANLRTIPTIPQVLRGDRLPELLEVRGEVYIRQTDFLRLNRRREEEGYGPYANARNLAAGSLKLLDSAEAAQRCLQFMAYEIGASSEKFDGHRSVLAALESYGLPVNSHWAVRGFDEIWSRVEFCDRERRTYDFGTDGAVLKVDDHRLRRELGTIATAPRWAIAYKYEPESALTVLENIRLAVGRTGVVTPIADLRPVHLAGSLIRHATLHNASEIARKDLRVGDTVRLQKAGEIIPAVVEVLLDRRPAASRPFAYPQSCPACGSDLIQIDGEIAIRCPNPDCPAQLRRRMEHFVSKSALDVGQLGPKMIGQLLKSGLVRHVADLFRLTPDQLLTLDHVQEKSARNLIDSIGRAKKTPLWRLLHGLGIPHVGLQTAKLLARQFKSMDRLRSLSQEELAAVPNIGDIVAASIYSFFRAESTARLLSDLMAVGLELQVAAATATYPGITGKSFAITGTFASHSRDQIKDWLESLGAHVRGAVSRNTDGLFCGERAGSKEAMARQLGLTIYDEGDLLSMMARTGVGQIRGSDDEVGI